MTSALRSAKIRYVFLGKELGARRGERECYVDGKVDYDLVERLPAFREGLERVRRGVEKFRVALLCAEKDPLTCHRAILVAKQFREEADVKHILSDGSLESITLAEERLLKTLGLGVGDLFRSNSETLLRAYRLQAERIAYSERPESKKVELNDEWY